MERIEVDNKDKPIEDIIIQRTSVFVDPFTEADEILAKERAEEMAKTKEKEQNLAEKKRKAEAGLKTYSKGIGKFINPQVKKEARKFEDEDLQVVAKKKKKDIKHSMNDFSGW